MQGIWMIMLLQQNMDTVLMLMSVLDMVEVVVLTNHVPHQKLAVAVQKVVMIQMVLMSLIVLVMVVVVVPLTSRVPHQKLAVAVQKVKVAMKQVVIAAPL